MPGRHKVTAHLVSTYDLSPADAKDVQQIDYLCVYEYEYDGVTYKYHARQWDNFSPVPEELDLYFAKDPAKASPARKPGKVSPSTRTVMIVGGIVFLLIFIQAIRALIAVFSESLPMFITFAIFAPIIWILAMRKQKTAKSKNEMLEDAV